MIKVFKTKLKGGRFKVPVTLEVTDSRITFQFPFNRPLMEEIKLMKGHKWHGYDEKPRKVWSVKNCERNWFQIKFLAGQNPYAYYEQPLVDYQSQRPLFKNQLEMVRYGLTYKRVLLACEMGLGKTLAAIEIMENSGHNDWIWVGPRSALAAVRLDFKKWGLAPPGPVLMTYDGLRKAVEDETIWIPQGIVLDESSKVKNPTAKRSQAASIVIEEMHKKHKDPHIILMSGSPAPRSPADFYHQLELVCPGFLKEGDYNKFKRNLAIIVEKDGPSGVYPELVTWLDNERKCAHCGKFPEEHFDDLVSPHDYTPSKNEVARLYKRMKGPVLTQFKKDCLDLPEKHFIRYEVEPSKSTLRLLNMIKINAARTIEALIQIRELSDGFQYEKSTEGTELTTCPRCKGNTRVLDYDNPENPEQLIDCPKCEATGLVHREERKIIEVPCPKDQLLIDLLDEYDSVGRFVVYAGFQASVDRVAKICRRYKWDVVKVDGRGWNYYSDQPFKGGSGEMLETFQAPNSEKIVFVGNPAAAGMGLTLTASPAIFFYSNSFNAEDRIQAIERIHRPGMDLNKGAKIIDVVHLPVDAYILENLDKKMNLQSMSLGQLKEHM